MSIMPIFHNTTNEDFITWLRYNAIDAKAPARVINAIDCLRGNEDLGDELVKAQDELYEMEKSRNDILREFESLIKAIDENIDPDKSPAFENAVKMARIAIERHS